jgi:acyl carrier protein
MTMSMQAITEAIHTLFPGYTGEVTEKTTADDVPGWDSVSHVQLIFLLEELTDKSIDLGKTLEISNIGDLARLLDGDVAG